MKFAVLALAAVALLITPWVDAHIVTPFTRALVHVCAAIINFWGGQAQGIGSVLTIPGGGVEVANGCNAVEVCILLAAAILPYPASARARAFGVLLCVGMLQVVNLARIISLLYLSRSAPALFEVFHLYVWDALIVLEGVVAFFWWAGRQQSPRRAAA